jgi:DNA-binding NarL/FixJ family response regulator
MRGPGALRYARRRFVSEMMPPCVLIVADASRLDELVESLEETLAAGPIRILASTGGDETVDMFVANQPHVVVVTATLETGDSGALIEALRGMVPQRSDIGIVLVGDANGPIRTVLDAGDIAPDRFVSSPIVESAFRFAVNAVLEAVLLIRTNAPSGPIEGDATAANNARAARLARWEAIADSMIDLGEEDEEEAKREPAPLPPPLVIRPRRQTESPEASASAWKPGNTAELDKSGRASWSTMEVPTREPTMIIRDPEPGEVPAPIPPIAPITMQTMPPQPATPTDYAASSEYSPMPLAELLDARRLGTGTRPVRDDDIDDLDDLGDALGDLEGGPTDKRPALTKEDFAAAAAASRGARTQAPSAPPLPPPPTTPPPVAGDEPPVRPSSDSLALDGRDFARQLRAKMSMMAQRLFQGGAASTSPPPSVDLKPKHDHHTEIDLAELGEEQSLERGVTEIEGRAQRMLDARELTTSPGTWDTAIKERGLPDQGEIVRGLSDAAMLLAKMFAQASTGRIGFKRDDAEKVVYFDQGRPVFASSSEQRDRMGELLVREGKITASQYERCQTVVAESGRRMGEILVDFGYLKRRELLPAVRRHVEDIVYSLFGWDRGTYHVVLEETPSAERIRLSRHPAALILEGVRRKLDRSSLERLIGAPSTVIEVPDRERLGGIINLGDLAPEERGALAAFDAQSDLSTVARAAGVDVADVLPLAWGLCVLGLATARRTDTEVPDEASALVGETDLAIDRERVRARWQLVSEADYFALLGVRRDATAFEIRRAYQAARRDFAQDSFPNDLRRELAQELDDIAHVLDEAFRVLRDDRLRLTYLSNLFE